MNNKDALSVRFESHRDHLRGVAFRMLGSLDEADDVVQEAWLRLARVDPDSIQNLLAWLTTAVSRLCLDILRARRARREDLVGLEVPDDGGAREPRGDPAQETLLAESVGRALLVVLEALEPAERVALVMHDMCGVPFDEIAPIVGRSSVAAKKLASRARQRVRGEPMVSAGQLASDRAVIEAFLAATRSGDLNTILAVLAPDIVRRADREVLAPERPAELSGADSVAKEIAVFGQQSQIAELALVDGRPGIVIAPAGRLRLVLAIKVENGKIAAYELIASPKRLRQLRLAVLDF